MTAKKYHLKGEGVVSRLTGVPVTVYNLMCGGDCDDWMLLDKDKFLQQPEMFQCKKCLKKISA